jgi:anthranilate synthase component 2
MKVLILDNYDSFTYNLVHITEHILKQKVEVVRNDVVDMEKIREYDKIILSPGPGIPSEAGILLPLIKRYAATKSILGVCLGHQAIGEAFGAKLVNLSTVFHGVARPVHITQKAQQEDLFKNLPEVFEAGRYHSWIVSEEQLPQELEITAKDDNGYIMALKHKEYDVQGVQFHPESVLTPCGETIIRNWLEAK